MHIVVCYDVVNDRKRTKLAKALKNFLERVQKSVFEGDISENRYLRMKKTIEKIIDLEIDTVRIYRLCERCIPATEIIGTGIFVEDQPEDIVV